MRQNYGNAPIGAPFWSKVRMMTGKALSLPFGSHSHLRVLHCALGRGLPKDIHLRQKYVGRPLQSPFPLLSLRHALGSRTSSQKSHYRGHLQCVQKPYQGLLCPSRRSGPMISSRLKARMSTREYEVTSFWESKHLAVNTWIYIYSKPCVKGSSLPL